MQHFLNLDKCECGAYRYLAIREHKRSYEVYLIHHSHSQLSPDQRKYAKLASIPKHRLNIHETRVNEMPEEKRVALTCEQTLLLKSILRQLQQSENIVEGSDSQDVQRIESIQQIVV